jgi:hypothetical protein
VMRGSYKFWIPNNAPVTAAAAPATIGPGE